MTWQYPTIFLANFLFIFLKAFQQRNVAYDNYGWVLPTSFGLALTEVYVIASIAKTGFTFPIVLTIGLAAGTGAWTAMKVHRRHVSRGSSLNAKG